jgi:predicted transcriptional regulator
MMTAQEIIHEIEQLPHHEWEKLQEFLDLNHWQIEQIKKAVASADRGEFVSDKMVAETFQRLKS